MLKKKVLEFIGNEIMICGATEKLISYLEGINYISKEDLLKWITENMKRCGCGRDQIVEFIRWEE